MIEAKVLKILIASPSDVAAEHQVIHKVVNEWNVVNAEDKGVFLMPISWETHSHPEMGGRPQAIINKQLLSDADLLVAVFWTRTGTPTGEAASGTIEEIQEHLKAGKPAMIYFSSVPVRLDSVNSEQYNLLQQFKAEYMKKGLIETFESISEFQEILTRQLTRMLIYDDRFVEFHRNRVDGKETLKRSSSEFPNLTGEQKELLLEASRDRNGMILSFRTMDGLSISTNKREFVSSKNSRSEAKWKSALEGLGFLNLIEDRGYKGEIFAVTMLGYNVADYLGRNA